MKGSIDNEPAEHSSIEVHSTQLNPIRGIASMSNYSYPYGEQQGQQLYNNPSGLNQQQQYQPQYQQFQSGGSGTYGFPPQSQQLGANPQNGFNAYTRPPPPQPTSSQNPTTGGPSYATAIDQLSFLTPQDQQKFKDLFNSATNSVSISPDNARGILLKSNLSPHQLARIWDLSDINKSGDLLFPEFALALHLCNVALRGNELPYVLDQNVKEEVTSLVDKISFSIPEEDATNFQSDRPTPQLNVSASNIFTQPQQPQQQQPVSNLAHQPTGFGFGNSTPSQPTGFQPQQTGFQPQSNDFQQSLPFGSQSQTTSAFQSKPQDITGFDSSTLNTNQETNFPSLIPQHQSLQHQRTGFESQKPALPDLSINQQQQQSTGLAPLQNQLTGAQGLIQQQTGLVPLKTQATGNQPLQQQPTGLIPLQNQNTGGQPLKQQPTGLVPLQGQNTGGQPLKQQPTGLIPLQGQQTGTSPPKLNNQQTGLIPLQNQQTGQQPLQQQQHTGIQPLTREPTGLVPLATTATGSVALQTQLTGPAPLHSQRTGFGNFEPLRQQKTGVGQNSLFLQNLLQPPATQQPSFFNSLNYTTETITPQEKQLFNKIFENYDTNRKGLLTADVSAEIFRKSGLNRSELEKVWDLVTRPNQTHLDKESFQTGMWLVYKRLNGFDLPDALPESLKPSSIKILDDVKNQLKVNPNARSIKKSSNSRMDGSRFKNNDDDFVMSSSRNRRRTTQNNKQETAASTNSKPKEILSIDELKKRIREKKILLDAFDATGSQFEKEEIDHEKEDLEIIARLKQEIKNLPNVSNTNDDERSQLKQKFNSLTSQVPLLLNEISQIDNEITRLKLELYKIKNPSFILGSGPDGQITEADRRKAKSKSLLAAKMAKLTGKPIDPEVQNWSDEQGKIDEEATRIQDENKKNQQIIRDVESSIKDISSNVMNSFSSQVDHEAYKKWELGVGVQPEVQEFIKSFRLNDISNRFTRSLILDNKPSSPSPVQTPSYKESPNISSPQPISSSSSSEFKTPEERKAYIREQAKKKMSERLAKFGINRSSSARSSNNSSPSSAKPQLNQPTPQQPHPIPPEPVQQPVQQSVQQPAASAPVEEESSSDDDDDEEEFQRMEEIRRLKRLERDARLAQLKTESQPAQESENSNQEPPKFHDSNPFAFK